MKTKRVYKEDVYKKELTSEVTGVFCDDNKILLTFKETIFFPTGGGQSCDIGFISINDKKYKIIDVSEQDDEIYHRVLSVKNNSTTDSDDSLVVKDNSAIDRYYSLVDRYEPPIDKDAPPINKFEFKVGDPVLQNIDWTHRFDNMQRHCGEHILSGIMYKLYRGINRGFHMGDDYMTIDISLENSQYNRIDWSMAEAAELEANRVIWENLPVISTHYDSKEEASNEPLRKELKLEEDITIVRIGSFENPSDAVACCGTHPAFSGQVGMLKIYKLEQNKGMTRIYFEAGERALKKYQSEYNVMTQISNKLSAGQDDLLEKFKSMELKNQEVKDRLFKIEKSMLADRVERIKSHLENLNSKIYYEDTGGLNPKLLQLLSKDLVKIADSKLIILANNDTKFVLIVTSKDSFFDCGEIIKNKALHLGGKGGGSKVSAQVTFANAHDLNEFIKSLTVNDNLIL